MIERWTAAEFRDAGDRIYGHTRWASQLARDREVDSRTVRRWLAGDILLPLDIQIWAEERLAQQAGQRPAALVLTERADHTLWYGLTHTAFVPRSDVEALTADQRAYLDARLSEITSSFEAMLCGLIIEATKENFTP